MDEMLLPWVKIRSVAAQFGSLTTLTASSNILKNISHPLPAWSRLTSLTLEYNDFTSISDLSNLSSLEFLETLLLKGNKISKISADSTGSPPIFRHNLHYVDLSYNAVSDWSFVDELINVFPGLAALRFSHNPVYDTISNSKEN